MDMFHRSVRHQQSKLMIIVISTDRGTFNGLLHGRTMCRREASPVNTASLQRGAELYAQAAAEVTRAAASQGAGRKSRVVGVRVSC